MCKKSSRNQELDAAKRVGIVIKYFHPYALLLDIVSGWDFK